MCWVNNADVRMQMNTRSGEWHMEPSQGHVILSAAKDLYYEALRCANQILRCAQDDRGRRIPQYVVELHYRVPSSLHYIEVYRNMSKGEHAHGENYTGWRARLVAII